LCRLRGRSAAPGVVRDAFHQLFRGHQCLLKGPRKDEGKATSPARASQAGGPDRLLGADPGAPGRLTAARGTNRAGAGGWRSPRTGSGRRAAPGGGSAARASPPPPQVEIRCSQNREPEGDPGRGGKRGRAESEEGQRERVGDERTEVQFACCRTRERD